MIEETLYWHHPKDALPDDESTILIETKTQLAEGFRDAGVWRWANAELITEKVISWASMPSGTIHGKGGN